jgi:C4-dicarboxylate-specific signal transduction histidine kinase
VDKLNAISLVGDRPAAWPNRGPEKHLPQAVEQLLTDALRLTPSKRAAAVTLAESAVDLARDMADSDVLARVLSHAAVVLRHARRPDRAFLMCLEAQRLMEQSDDRWRGSGVLLERGLCYLAVGEHERALELLRDAAERFATLKDPAQLARCWVAMSKAHVLSSDLSNAVQCAADARSALADAAGTPELRYQVQAVEAYLRVLRGREFARTGDTRMANSQYVQALKALPDLQDIALDSWDPASALTLDTMIAVALATGDEPGARAALRALASWARRWRSPLDRGLTWLRLAEFRIMCGQVSRAIACARLSAAVLDGLPLELERVAAHHLLAQLLEQTGDLRRAYSSYVEAARVELQRQQESINIRTELLNLDLDAEHAWCDQEHTLAYAQRLSNVGPMIADVTHELSQPLASIKILSEDTVLMLESGQREAAAASLTLLKRASAQVIELANQSAALPDSSKVAQERVLVRRAVEEALAATRGRLDRLVCQVVQHIDDTEAQTHTETLVRVLVILLVNALDAMEHSPVRTITIATERQAHRVEISVADTGSGLSDKARVRLFQPFTSTKEPSQHLGLSLALARDSLRNIGGDLVADDRCDVGAAFIVNLPRAPSAR